MASEIFLLCSSDFNGLELYVVPNLASEIFLRTSSVILGAVPFFRLSINTSDNLFLVS